MQCEMQSASTRIWTRVTVSISFWILLTRFVIATEFMIFGLSDLADHRGSNNLKFFQPSDFCIAVSISNGEKHYTTDISNIYIYIYIYIFAESEKSPLIFYLNGSLGHFWPKEGWTKQHFIDWNKTWGRIKLALKKD